jgi:hypothetical protein
MSGGIFEDRAEVVMQRAIAGVESAEKKIARAGNSVASCGSGMVGANATPTPTPLPFK